MDYEHDYYSDQCAGCKWAEWRGGCLNKAGASDGSDTLDSAEEGECAHFEAGAPQGRQPHPGERLSVVVPLDDYSSLRARAEAAEARAAQAEADARLMLAAYYGADSASIARFGLGDGLLSEGDLQRLDALRGATFYASESETAAAMLRILATSGA